MPLAKMPRRAALSGYLLAILLAGCAVDDPPIEVKLADLEQAYDANPATAKARFGDHSLRVHAVVSSIDENSVQLETVFLLPVTAEFASPPIGVVRGPVTLDCARAQTVAIGGGYKPKLLGCAVAANVERPAKLPAPSATPENAAVKPTRISASALARAFAEKPENAEVIYGAGPFVIDGTVQGPGLKGTLVVATGSSPDQILMHFGKSGPPRARRGTMITASCRTVEPKPEITAVDCVANQLVDDH